MMKIRKEYPMPAIASLDDLKSVQTDVDRFKTDFPEAYNAMSDLLKRHRKVGYKNICKLFLGESTPEKLKAE
jgi:hypothetical protein